MKASDGTLTLKAVQSQVVALALEKQAAAGAAGDKKKALKKAFKAKVAATPGVVLREDGTVVYDKKAAKA